MSHIWTGEEEVLSLFTFRRFRRYARRRVAQSASSLISLSGKLLSVYIVLYAFVIFSNFVFTNSLGFREVGAHMLSEAEEICVLNLYTSRCVYVE